jgi:peroxiredoxin
MPLLPAAAAVISLVLAAYVAMTLVMLRQNGRLLLRVDALEARVPAAAPQPPGLPKNTPAPAFNLQSVDGDKVTLDQLTEAGKPVVLLFAEPGCGPCESLFPEVARWQREHADRRSIVMISSGRVKVNREAATRFGLVNVLVQKGREVAEAYRSTATPSAVMLRDGVVATPMAQGADDVRSLIVRASLPPAVKVGEKVPSLQLTGLDGTVTDLSEIRGRNTMLLFWDPAHPTCQNMVSDLKTRERVRLAVSAPELVIVASGPERDIRAMASTELSPGGPRVLLDPHLAARTLFGAEGTPSAVLIDEQGRVASAVGEGYIPSFEMAGLVPFVPSESGTVDAMLKLAGVAATDVVYDLGCGDGRVVIAAAKTYGARGVGVDIDPERIAEARANAKKAGVEHLVQFEERALLDCDLRGATVVTMYLLPKMNMELRPKLLAELLPGTRVVSHAFTMGDWKPDRETTVSDDTLYLWTILERP